MTPSMLVTLGVVALVAGVFAQTGPGAGPWSTASPESVGLNTAALTKAAAEIKSKARNRKCFVVAKEGKIVYEEYYGSSISSRNTAYSTTKSLCSSLFGMSVKQGWGNVEHDVHEYSRDGLKCTKGATMKNVLTMTGQSRNLSQPEFKYDALGTNCYDTIQGYILQNNPDRLGTEAWMRKYFWDEVGFEHSEWKAAIWLQCGTSSQMSCRDLTRHAQLWLNGGFWPGKGQLLDEKYVAAGTQWVYPDQGEAYGYGLRLRPLDAVDPKVAYFGGVNLQCAFFSKEHDAIVVSMGNDLASSCQSEVWEDARHAIVSKGHPAWKNISQV
eukprot:m.62497 g.62497  ORF g.62497 m.62497 type:complete len:326 (+) comp17691_c0_seq1:2354-3331(+)